MTRFTDGWKSDVLSFKLATAACITLLLVFWISIRTYYSRAYRFWRRQGVDGPPPVIPFGNSEDNMKGRTHELDMQHVARYGRVFGLYQGTTAVLVVTDPEILKDVLVRDFHVFADRATKFYHRIERQHLMSSNGKCWRDMRNIMTPTFTSGKMKVMHQLIMSAVSNLLQHVQRKLVSGSADFNNKQLYSDLTLGVIASCAFGTDTNPHQTEGENIVIVMAKKFFNLNKYKHLIATTMPQSVLRLMQYTPTSREALDFLVNLSREILNQRKIGGDEVKRVDLLQLMLETERNQDDGTTFRLTDDQIISNIILILLAGYDTTSTLISMATYSLALNPDVQERLRNEIESAVKADAGELRYETIMHLKYLDAVVNETLRLYPSVVKIERTATQDYVIPKLGIRVKKGNRMQIPIYALHHQAEFFPEPEKFVPDRFLPQNKDQLVPYSFMPFNTGPRNCIGSRFALLEAKTALVSVLLKYELNRSPRTAVPLDLRSSFLLSAAEVIINYKERQ